MPGTNGQARPLIECVRHFGSRFPGKKGYPQRKTLADFTGASYNGTVLYWYSGKRPPMGEYKWRIATFLHLVGYRVAEFERMREAYRQACKMLAFGLLSLDELAKAFGYVGDYRKDSVLRTLEQNTDMVPENAARLRLFLEEYEETVAEAEESFKRTYTGVLLPSQDTQRQTSTPELPADSVKPATVPEANTGLPKIDVITSLASLLQAATPLAKFLESDDCSPEDRAELRRLLNGDGLFKLSNILARLCGERARKDGQ